MSLQCSVTVMLVACRVLLWGIVPTAQQHPALDVNVFDFDASDIFDDELTPMQIFTQQLRYIHHLRKGNSSSKENAWQSQETNGEDRSMDLFAAFSAMRYHRQMMNEFLASDYITQKILGGRPASDTIFLIGKRMGSAKNYMNSDNNSTGHKAFSVQQERLQKHISNHRLLDDEGSSRYKSWLGKMTTLEDIYRQLEGKTPTISSQQKTKRLKGIPIRRQTINLDSSLDVTQADDQEMDYDDGDITGYALTNNPYEYPSPHYDQHKYWPLSTAPSDVQMRHHNFQTINKNGYDSGYDEYGAHLPSSYSHPQTPTQPTTAANQIKEIGLKDITDIALTTLAFLSFGMFILQVLMCITMGKDDTSNLMMLPMEAAEINEIPTDGIEEIRRKRRSIANQTDPLIMMNDLARRVLFSIDAVLHLPKDDGSCHYWSLCKNNRYAKQQTNGQKFWIPIWSLGISWLSTRVATVSSITDYVRIIHSLKAIVTGLGENDCTEIYRNACQE